MLVAAGSDAVVTVVVVTYSGVRWLSRCLDAVARQDLVQQGRALCWVVDNGSQDGSADLLAARDDVRLIRSTRNLGFAGGNNLALREVATPYVVLLNDDAVPEPGWLAALVAPFADERVAAVASKLLLQPRFVAVPLEAANAVRLGVAAVRRGTEDITSALVWDPLLSGVQEAGVRWCTPESELLVPLGAVGERLEAPVRLALKLRADRPAIVRVAGQEHRVTPEATTVEVELPAGTPTTDVVNSAGTVLTAGGYAADRGFGRADDGRYDTSVEVFGGCGASLGLRTAAIHQVGGFDEAWFLYYEDVDLCWRLRLAGWTVRYEPSSVVRHEHSASVGTRSDLHVFHDARNRLLTLVKNASLPLVLRTVGRYPLETALALVRLPGGDNDDRRAAVLRLRVLGSFVRLLPGVLARRRAVQRRACVPAAVVEAWLGREPGGCR